MNRIDKPDRLPAESSSFWIDTARLPSFGALKEDVTADVAVVGGGITGITSAYLLAKAGMRVAVVEAGRLCGGTSGYTTAKITAQHGLIYDELIGHYGEEKARAYYRANDEAKNWIEQIVHTNRIPCTFSRQPAIIYADRDADVRKIEKEASAYQKIGIPGRMTETLPVNVPVKGALIMDRQAQFHPTLYLSWLIDRLCEMDVSIYEQTTAIDILEDQTCTVLTKEGPRIHCRDVLVCTLFPFFDQRFYFARMYPERAYLMAVETGESFPGGMYLNVGEPRRSIRGLAAGERTMALVGGENHKTGWGEDTFRHYQELANFANQLFGTPKIVARWSAHDYTTLDNVPYIGALSSDKKHIFGAAGFRKWGMTGGTVAARILTDRVLDRENPYADVFDPARFVADPMIRRFISVNSGVAGHLLKGKLEKGNRAIDRLEPNQGAVVSLNGKRAGAYKNKNGKLTVVDTTCTHLGCEVNWNQAERTWDCPCHGSRYRATGEVIDGPAKEPLARLYVEPDKSEDDGSNGQ